jgi:ketosteroid isomerase-like protein
MRHIRPLLLLLLLAAPSRAQSTATAGVSAASQTTVTARALVALENDWARGVVRRDTALFARMLDPRFVYTEDAAVMGKDEVIKSIRDGDRVERASNTEMVVHDFGGTAVVTGILRLEGMGAKGRFDHRYRFTDTWMRRGGHWRIVAAQDYLMPAT